MCIDPVVYNDVFMRVCVCVSVGVKTASTADVYDTHQHFYFYTLLQCVETVASLLYLRESTSK